jgi:Transketolase, thiamine diphosphate binding domain
VSSGSVAAKAFARAKKASFAALLPAAPLPVGTAISKAQLAARFTCEGHKILNHHIWVMVGDADLIAL